MPIKLIIADHHHLIRFGIEKLLSDIEGISVSGMADTGELAVKLSKELSKKEQSHVVLMDIRIPGIGGLEAIRKILRNNFKTKIIALAACIEDPYPELLIQAGAVGLLTNNVNLEEMVLAIRTVYAGKKYLSLDVAQGIAFRLITGSKSHFSKLSDREFQIMLMVINGTKVEKIADLLCLSPKTVNSYRYRIFDKLSVTNNVELTHCAIKQGLYASN